ncbi:MAG: hypothetical protein EVA89_31645 [Sandaracinaceae bacterium]|nr:MAG: hypothetical protein EVA89_31645 [Sandaracinaceae bacterium]
MLNPDENGLDFFLAPLSQETFFGEHFDRSWVHIPAESHRRLNLFPLDSLEEELRRRRPWDQKRDGAPTYLRLLRDGRVGKPVTSLNEVIAGCHEGMSLVLNSVHETVTEIAEACEVLERAFGVAASANVYFSPPRSQGFDVHVDTHDVFVIQTHGAKRWQIHPPQVFPAPKKHWLDGALELEVFNDIPDESEPETITLREGDVLYLPRGVPHAAESQDEASLHVTFGVDVLTWGEILELCLRDTAIHRRALRAAVDPSWMLPGAEAQLAEGLRERVAELADAQLPRALERLRRSSASAVAPGALRALLRIEELDDETEIRMAKGVVTFGTHLGHHWLAVGAQKHRVPPRTRSYCQFVAERETFRVRDLPGDLPGDSRRVFVRWLLSKGLASLAEGRASS